jgi:hypothetical protein
MIFGYFIGANNWAHGFGFASGAAWGWAIRPEWLRARRGRPVGSAMGVIGATAVAGAVGLALSAPGSGRHASLDTSADAAVGALRESLAPLVRSCTALARGDDAAARAASAARSASGPVDLDDLRATCAAMASRREDCRAAIADASVELAPEERVVCRALLEGE